MTPKDITTKAIPILKSQGVLKAALFGSMVRGEAKKRAMLNKNRLLKENLSGCVIQHITRYMRLQKNGTI